MIYKLATKENVQDVYNIVQHTIKTIYPKYYPAEVVDFFCELHNKDAIAKDIENGHVKILEVDDKMIATGCFVENGVVLVYEIMEKELYRNSTEINYDGRNRVQIKSS